MKELKRRLKHSNLAQPARVRTPPPLLIEQEYAKELNDLTTIVISKLVYTPPLPALTDDKDPAPNETARCVVALATAIQTWRKAFRSAGDAAAVPLEPPPQGALLDAVTALPGIVGGVVPGGGHYFQETCFFDVSPMGWEGLG
jgi:phosphomevalonate kinase